MSNLAYAEYYTKEDYESWEGEWELIYGSAYAMAPSPLVSHQNINGRIFYQLSSKLENCPKCSPLFEIDWQISDDTIVKPDSLVICYEPKEKLTLAPDIIFEVISKSTARRDETLKFQLYQDEGVKYYIMVYPEEKKAKVYKLYEYKYVKIGDFSHENYLFELDGCSIDFDFGFIWKKK